MKKFFQQMAASFLGTLVAIVVLLSLGASGLVLLFILVSTEADPVLEEKTALVLDLATPIRDTSPTINLRQSLLGNQQEVVPLRTVVNAIEKAAEDDRIVAIFIDGRRGSQVEGYGNLSEVQQALAKFKQSGKKIVAYGLNYSEPGYYLASTADSILVNPMGGLEINGLGAQPIFFTGALAKAGIGVQVLRVGSYKGAVEAYTRENLSPENRQQQQQLLDQIWQIYLDTVAENRQLTVSQLQAIANDQGILFADAALREKLVDKLAYWDQVLAELKQAGVWVNEANQMGAGNDKDFKKISLTEYHRLQTEKEKKQYQVSKSKIALVYLEGSIVNGRGTWESVGGDRYGEILQTIRQDDDIKAVVLRINSPGGSASAADIIWREVELLQAQKPVIISMGNVAASGGYWIATAGEKIVAQPNTITGSIGVFSILFNVENLGDRLGLNWDEVTTGQLANVGSSVKPKTELELAIFQRAVDQVYAVFLDKVGSARNLTPAALDSVAQGRVWTGLEAQKVGLVDQLGGLETAVTMAATKAELGKQWQVQEYPTPRGLNSLLFSNLGQSLAQGDDVNSLALPPFLQTHWQQLERELEQLSQFNDPQGIYARLPFFLHALNP
ncbi:MULTISPECIES: signal peptide peptidase SppA [unclassified Synechocystis]|uniref:signal peptide peptidase SppA n=1 Tax=unclassified Synechocystis TaxID=2640012 RepID=UPI0003FA2F6B|nr:MULTISPECIES: signal peptide peptidase SppA [unclassified Synechocystis]AIE72560.1 Peptidase S49, protease IV [Synechocystis sp. PCC 6714]MCT0254478.1 signal peptide peptidase SppA [Synechocystis sp. CS-94]